MKNNKNICKTKMRTVFYAMFLCVLGASLLFPVNAQAVSAGTDVNVTTVLQNSEPKLIVDSYEIVQGEKSKGETFTMKVNIRNTNKYADAYNVLSTYTSDTDNVRLVDEKTNQHFEEVIKAGEVVSYELEMEVMDVYEMDTMVMNFMFTYVDGKGNGYTNSSMISPRIVKNCVMEINSLSVAQNAVVGAKALVNVRYSSTGTLPIKSATMIIEGDILEDRQEIALEGVSDNEQKYLDYYVSFRNPGTQTVSISFRYVDENGTEYTVEPESFQVEVSPYEAAVASVTQADDFGFITEQNKGYVFAACIGGIVIVLIAAAILVVKNKEKKEEK